MCVYTYVCVCIYTHICIISFFVILLLITTIIITYTVLTKFQIPSPPFARFWFSNWGLSQTVRSSPFDCSYWFRGSRVNWVGPSGLLLALSLVDVKKRTTWPKLLWAAIVGIQGGLAFRWILWTTVTRDIKIWCYCWPCHILEFLWYELIHFLIF